MFASAEKVAGAVDVKDEKSPLPVEQFAKFLQLVESVGIQVDGSLSVGGNVQAGKFASLSEQDLLLQLSGKDAKFVIVSEKGERLFSLDQNGKISIKASGEALGKATLKAGEKEVLVTAKSISTESRIYINADQFVDFKYTEVQAGEGFKIELTQPIAKDIIFTYWIIN
jgi:hypothetical protein